MAKPNLLQRFRASWGLMKEIEQYSGTYERKSALPYSPPWKPVTYRELDFDRARVDGYGVNAAVGGCVRALTFAFPEPRPLVLDQTDERLPQHPLQALLSRPNPFMSHAELLVFVITYLGIGGNCYLYKVRSNAGNVVELWPYHDGHMTPNAGGKTWIKSYTYTIGGQEQEIPADDIVHLKWPMPDLAQPWIALSPLRQVAREVDTDTELTRMLQEILVNDIPIRTVFNLPAGTNLSETDYQVFMERISARHRGPMRGTPAVVEGVSAITNLNLNLRDLDLTALRGVPESRICSAYGVPPEVAMLSVGQAHSTENNLYAADVRFTTRTLVPLWTLVSGELTQDLAPEFSGNVRVAYDIASIQALKKDETATWARVISGYDANLITRNEARAEMGLMPIASLVRTDPEGDMFKNGSTALAAGESGTKEGTPILGYHIDAGVVSRNEARAQLALPPEDPTQSDRIRELKEQLSVIQAAVNVGFPLDIALNLIGMEVALPEPVDITPQPAQLTDDQKARTVEIKAKADQRRERVKQQMRADTQRVIAADFEAAAAGL